jgi:hypothetical protein
MDEREQHRSFESRLLQQVEQRVRLFAGKGLPSRGFEIQPMPDGADAVRAMLQRLDVGNPRHWLDTLPGTRAMQISFRRGLVNTLRGLPRVRIRAQVLAPIDALVLGTQAGPVGREAVLDALARYDLLPTRAKPSVVALGSASGFTPAALELVHQPGPPRVVLIGGREDGGYDVHMSPAMSRSVWGSVFELESADERLKRLQYHLDRHTADLESSGVSVAQLSTELGIPAADVEKLVQQACRADPRLMLLREGGQLRVCRSPVPIEGQSMKFWNRIRRWLGFKPSVAERVQEMTRQRVALEAQRAEFDRKISELEKSEREGLQSIAAEPRVEAKKQIAVRVARTQRELKRHRAQAQVLTDQIEVLGTHIYHLTLKAQGDRMNLPSAEELAQEAAQAEQVLTSVAANADLARSIEVGVASPGLDAEVDDILKQAEAYAPPAAAADSTESARTAAPDSARAPVTPERAPAAGLPPLPPTPQRAGEPNKQRELS